jgi:Carbohydrate binding domain
VVARMIAWVLLGMVLSGELTWGQSAPTTRMWKGQEMWQFGGGKYKGEGDDWRSMPGATIGMRYAGKGPLPPPIEFAIPLEKPLPLGTYRLFVKNFHLGKMEATLGDITLPLTIRRFDWTPGVTFETNAPVEKIVLRYFPVRIVADTGAKQEQYYIIQGVFLTTDMHQVPIRAGEIVTSVPQEKPPLKAGNYLQNAGFECGLYPWGKANGYSGYVLPQQLDTTTAAEGKTSLKMTPLGTWAVESKMVPLAPGPYTLSFYAKADKPVRLGAAVYGATEDLKGDAPTGVGRTVELTDQWKRYSAAGRIESKPGLLYTVRFGGTQEAPANVWLDAVQLENGAEATAFRPAQAVEAGLVCDLPGRIVYEGQPGDATLLVYGPSGPASATVRWRIVDYWGKDVAGDQKQIPLAKDHAQLPFALFAGQRGIFRVLLSVGQTTSELTYSVLPPNSHLDSDYPQGTLGVDTHFDPAHLAILKRANFNWAISKFLGRWPLVEPKEGRFKFDDEGVAAARRAKMLLVIQPLNIDWAAQDWIRPYWKPGGGALWEAGKRQFYMQHWATYIEKLVGHFKDSVKHWEIENEPNYVYAAEEYAELLKLASERIRRVDPQATVVAVAGGGYREAYYEKVIQAVGTNCFDVVSVHFYGNEVPVHRSFAEYLKKGGLRGWNTETGATCPTFYSTLPDFESLRQKEYPDILQRDVQKLSAYSAQNYLLSRSRGGMERWFHYFARGTNAGPSQHTSRFGGGKELTEYDGALRANAVALSIASHFVDEATYHGPVDLDKRLQMVVFAKGGASVGCCWASAGQPLRLSRLPRELTFYDIMGNKQTAESLTVTDSVIYFTGRTSPDECAKGLQTITVSEN